jgi:hypothetical protein
MGLSPLVSGGRLRAGGTPDAPIKPDFDPCLPEASAGAERLLRGVAENRLAAGSRRHYLAESLGPKDNPRCSRRACLK